jgi:hypothetical protein
VEGSDLPVAVRIYGKVWVQGSGVYLRFKVSFIVQKSQEIGQLIMAVTLSYWFSAWGFLQGYDDADDDPLADLGSNWGIRAQRLALR